MEYDYIAKWKGLTLTNQQSIYGQSILLNERNVNTYLIIGTMSSGKSTFLNSLIGFELFPSRNTACTAKTFSYYGNPQINYFLHFNNMIKKPVQQSNLIMDQLEKWNQDSRIEEIKIEGPIITNKNKSFAVIDTPGPNNSMNKSHEKAMKDALSSSSCNSIIYVLNATQLGVDDDRKLLHFVKEYAELKDIIFVINKADMVEDTEKENLSLLAKNVQKYLEKNGFEKPVIYFVSSIAAVLAMKVQSNIRLTRKESATYWRLGGTLKKNLADSNINVSLVIENEDGKINNEIWNNSGIQSILNLL